MYNKCTTNMACEYKNIYTSCIPQFMCIPNWHIIQVCTTIKNAISPNDSKAFRSRRLIIFRQEAFMKTPSAKVTTFSPFAKRKRGTHTLYIRTCKLNLHCWGCCCRYAIIAAGLIKCCYLGVFGSFFSLQTREASLFSYSEHFAAALSIM